MLQALTLATLIVIAYALFQVVDALGSIGFAIDTK